MTKLCLMLSRNEFAVSLILAESQRFPGVHPNPSPARVGGSMSLLWIAAFALIPQPLLPSLGEGEQDFKVPLPSLGEGFRVRAQR
jgi:hypothetical protein